MRWGRKGIGRRGEREMRRKEKGERREGVRTNMSVFGRASRYTCRINDFDKFRANFGKRSFLQFVETSGWVVLIGGGCEIGGGC